LDGSPRPSAAVPQPDEAKKEEAKVEDSLKVKLEKEFDFLLDLRNFLHEHNGEATCEFFYSLVLKICGMSGSWEKGLPQTYLKLYSRAREWNPHYIRTCDTTAYDDDVHR
jgi:hypothetical protein